MSVRSARLKDAAELCAVINPIIAAGGTTAHRTPFDIVRMQNHYIAPPLGIGCMVFEGPAGILGYQSLVRPDPNHSAEAALGDEWGIIASFVAQAAQGQGAGGALFAETQKAARSAGLRWIDATIRWENTGGRAFYSALGFEDYRETDLAVSKRFTL